MEEEIIVETPREPTPIEEITGSVLVNNKNEIIEFYNNIKEEFKDYSDYAT